MITKQLMYYRNINNVNFAEQKAYYVYNTITEEPNYIVGDVIGVNNLPLGSYFTLGDFPVIFKITYPTTISSSTTISGTVKLVFTNLKNNNQQSFTQTITFSKHSIDKELLKKFGYDVIFPESAPTCKYSNNFTVDYQNLLNYLQSGDEIIVRATLTGSNETSDLIKVKQIQTYFVLSVPESIYAPQEFYLTKLEDSNEGNSNLSVAPTERYKISFQSAQGNNQNNPITHYDIQFINQYAESFNIIIPHVGNIEQSQSYECNAPEQEGVYSLILKAYDKYGNYSISESSVTLIVESSLCSSPRDFYIGGNSISNITWIGQNKQPSYPLFWKPPLNNGLNNEIVSYQILGKNIEDENYIVIAEDIQETQFDITLEQLNSLGYPCILQIAAINKYPSYNEFKTYGGINTIKEITTPEEPNIISYIPDIIIDDLILSWDSYENYLQENTYEDYSIGYLLDNEEIELGRTSNKNYCISFSTLPQESDIQIIITRYIRSKYIDSYSSSQTYTKEILTGQNIEVEKIQLKTDTTDFTEFFPNYFFDTLEVKIQPPIVTSFKSDIIATLWYNSNNSNWTIFNKYNVISAAEETTYNVNISNILLPNPGTEMGFYISYSNFYGQEVSTVPVYIKRVPLPELKDIQISNINYQNISFSYTPFLAIPEESFTSNYYLSYNDEYEIMDSIKFNPENNNISQIDQINFSLSSTSTGLMKEIYEKAIENKYSSFPGTLKIVLFPVSYPNCRIEKIIPFNYNFITPAISSNLIVDNERTYYNPLDLINFSFETVNWKDASNGTKGADIVYRVEGNNKIFKEFNENLTFSDSIQQANLDLSINYQLITEIKYADYTQTLYSNIVSVNIARWTNDRVSLYSLHKKEDKVSGIISLPQELCSSIKYNNFNKLECALFLVKEDKTETLVDTCYYDEHLLHTFIFTKELLPDSLEIPFYFTQNDSIPQQTFKVKVTFYNTSNQIILIESSEYILKDDTITVAIRKGRIGINTDNTFELDTENLENNSAVLINAIDESAPTLELNIKGEKENSPFIKFNNNSKNFSTTLYYNDNDDKLYCDNFYYPVTTVNNLIGDIQITPKLIDTFTFQDNSDFQNFNSLIDIYNELEEKTIFYGKGSNYFSYQGNNLPENDNSEILIINFGNNFKKIYRSINNINYLGVIENNALIWDKIYSEKNKPSPAEIGALSEAPVTSVNGYTKEVVLNAEDVGARNNTWVPTPEEVGARSNTWFPTARETGGLALVGLSDFAEKDFHYIYSHIPTGSLFIANLEDFSEIELNLNERNGIIQILKTLDEVKLIKALTIGGKEYIGYFSNNFLNWNLNTESVLVKNILDNSYFPQIINQWQEISYTSIDGDYTYDRWMTVGEGELFISQVDGYLQIGDGSNTTYIGIRQYFPENYLGKTLTAAIKTNEGLIFTYCSGQLTNEESDSSGVIKNSQGAVIGMHQISYNIESDLYFYEILIEPGNILNLEWAAVYEGQYDEYSLPTYHIKGYLNELQECQRYFYCKPTNAYVVPGYTTNTRTIYVFINTPVPMRVTPTILDTTEIVYIRGNGTTITTRFSSSTGTFATNLFKDTENFRLQYTNETAVFTSNHFYGVNLTNVAFDANLR